MNQSKNQGKKTYDCPIILMIIGGMGAGGKERQLIVHLKAMKERNSYAMLLVVLNPHGSREEEASLYADEVITIKRRIKVDLLSPFIKLVKITKKNNVQLIHSWGSGIWDLISLLVAKWCRVPFLHNGIQSAPSHLNLSNRLSKASALLANAVVANSQAGLSAFGMINHPRSNVIYNGLDLNRFSHFSNTDVNTNLCMVANFRIEKDHKTLILSMPAIIKVFPEVRLFLVGHDFGTMRGIKNLVNELGLSENVEFITNTLIPESYIANSRICILATHGEGISNVLLEYMALSKPIIVSNNGGNPEVIISGVNGHLIPPSSPEALSSSVIELLKNEECARKMGAAGKKMVEEKFSVPKMLAAFEKLYAELLNN